MEPTSGVGITSRSDTLVRQPGHQLTSAFGPIGEAFAVEPREALADGARRDLVHREPEAAPVEAGSDAALLLEHHVAGGLDELPHPLEIALAAQALARLAFGRDDLVEHELRRDRGVVEARQPQRRPAQHPGVPDHQVLDRRPLRVPRCSDPVTFGGGWMITNGGRFGSAVEPRAVRREDVRVEPALVDRLLELPRLVGLARSLAARMSGRLAFAAFRRPRSVRRHRPWLRQTNGPLVQRTNGVVVPPAGSVRSASVAGFACRRRPNPRGALSGATRFGSRATFTPSCPRGSHRPALAPGPSRRYSSRSSPKDRESSTASNRRRTEPGSARPPGLGSNGVTFRRRR